MRTLRIAWALLRMEWLQTLRTRAIWTYFLIPCGLFLPLCVAAGLGVASVVATPAVVALPLDTPEALPIEEALERRDLATLWTEDPAAALASGEVDAAVLYWQVGEGLRDADDDFDFAAHWHWRAMVAGDPDLDEEIDEAAEWAGNRVLEGWVVVAGGDPDRDLWLADVETVRAESTSLADSFGRESLLGYLVFVLGFLSYFMIAMGTASDRAEGVPETLAATAAPAWPALLARLLVPTAIELLGGSLLVGSMLMMMPDAAPTTAELLGGGLRLVCALLAVNSVYLAVGLWAKSGKDAYNYGSLPMMLSGGLLFVGLVDMPVWVPMAGVLVADTPGQLALGAASSLAMCAAVLALLSRVYGVEGARMTRVAGE